MSKRAGDYYEMPEFSPFKKVRTGMEWGKRWLIDFLMQLGREWDEGFYEQIEQYGNYSQIPLGDISHKGGSPPRSVKPKVGGHSSHRCGRDVDIYVISKDGVPRKHMAYGWKGFDLGRTQELGRLILKVGGHELEKVLIGGADLGSYLREQERALGLSGVIDEDSSGMHHNHFHIRMKNKDNSVC